MRAEDSRSYFVPAFALLFGGIFAAICVLVVVFELDPSAHPSPALPFLQGKDATHQLIILCYMILSGIGALGILLWGLIRRQDWARTPNFQRLVAVFLVVTVLISAFFYFYARRGLAEDQFVHRYDTFHYLMAPRYYNEIDYQDLYACVLQALKSRDVSDEARVRDLRSYHMTTAGELRKQHLCPQDNFSDARWWRFRKDLKIYTRTRGGEDLVRRAIRDRGYNGTPVHAALSGYLADKIPLTIATHNLLPLFDVLLICLMLYAVAVAFGWKIGLLFALSVFVIAADRWAIIGASWFRYAWFVTLTMGLVVLRRGSYGWSGMWMTSSALLNVFPVVFMVGIGIRGLVNSIKERRLVPRYKRFLAAAMLTGVVGLCIGFAPERHLDNYTGWFNNMEHHAAERFQGFGVGLKFPFIYRGVHTESEDSIPERERRQIFHDKRNAYLAMAGFLLLLGLGFALTTDDDVEASTVLGFTLFFCFLGTVAYYFACASLLVLGLYRRASSVGGVLLLASWFAASFLAHWALYATDYYRFMYNTVLSMAWTVWLVALLLWLCSQEGVLSRLGRGLTAPARP